MGTTHDAAHARADGHTDTTSAGTCGERQTDTGLCSERTRYATPIVHPFITVAIPYVKSQHSRMIPTGTLRGYFVALKETQGEEFNKETPVMAPGRRFSDYGPNRSNVGGLQLGQHKPARVLCTRHTSIQRTGRGGP
ncbi:hypothetical protein J6590_047729 [Homalodisca vitripennis]|nr:hypothetical protein J6590_047729 [Homalodisca vitripennis]